MRYHIFSVDDRGGMNYIISNHIAESARDALESFAAKEAGNTLPLVREGRVYVVLPAQASGLPCNPNNAQSVFRLETVLNPSFVAVPVSL